MKISYHLLEKLTLSKLDPEKLSKLLNTKAFEIEGIEPRPLDFTKVITAKVTRTEAHPNADRLRIITLSTKDTTIAPVVCGAFNFGMGDVVALALPGARIPHNIHSQTHESFVLEEARIRGVTSKGMICAGFELGLTTQLEQGVLVLPPETPLGIELASLISNDTILEVALPTNRPDLFSHEGIAREIMALRGSVFKQKEPLLKLPKPRPIKTRLPKEVLSFTTLHLEGVHITDSPLWMKLLLERLGVKSINNVVDLTNYIRILTGQPSHAFDADTLQGDISIRYARKNEKITTLNNKAYTLDSSMLVLADNMKTLDIAGIMGGKDTEISRTTQNVILTIASFDASTIRRASQKLGLKSDSSLLYEKGLSPLLVEHATKQAANLISKLGAGTVVAYAQYQAKTLPQKPIVFSTNQINLLLGTELSDKEILAILEAYAIGIKKSGQKFTATPPEYRTDLTTPEDLAEEVARSYGLNEIPKKPFSLLLSAENSHDNKWQQFLQTCRSIWQSAGFTETRNHSFISEQDILHFGDTPSEYIAIENPLSLDQAYITKNHTIPLLKTLHRISINNTADSFCLFEINKSFFGYLNEPVFLGAVRSSQTLALESLIVKLKGEVEYFIKQLGGSFVAFSKKGSVLEIQLSNDTIGTISILTNTQSTKLDLPKSTVYASINLEKLFAHGLHKRFTPISKFPKVTRDISFILPSNIPWKPIESIITSKSLLLQHIAIVEADFSPSSSESAAFHKKLSGEAMKNYVVRLVFQGFDRTLTDREVSGILKEIMLQLQQELGAIIR